MPRLAPMFIFLFAPSFLAAAPPLEAPLTDSFGDLLPKGAIARLGTLRWKAGEGLGSIAFSPDGRMVAAASVTTILVWDYPSGILRRRYQADAVSAATSLIFTPNQTGILIGGRDNRVSRLLDLASGRLSLVGLKAEPNLSNGSVFSSDGHWCLSFRAFGSAHRFWLTETARPNSMRDVGSLAVRGDAVPIINAALTSDGQWAAFCAREIEGNRVVGRLYLLETTSGKCWPMSKACSENPIKLAFAPDDKSVVVACDRAMYRADFKPSSRPGRAPELSLACDYERRKDDDADVEHLLFSGDGKLLVAGNDGGQAMLWNARTGKAQLRLNLGPLNAIGGLAISPDAKTLAATSQQNSMVRLFDIPSGKQYFARAGHSGAINEIAFHPAGASLVSSSYIDHTVRTWDLRPKRTATVRRGVNAVEDRIQSREFAAIENRGYAYEQLSFSADGRTLVMGRLPGDVCVWRPETSRDFKSIQSGDLNRTALALSPDGKCLAIGGAEGVELLDVASGKPLPVQPRLKEMATRIAFSPDQRIVLIITATDSLYCWHRVNGEVCKPIPGAAKGCANRYFISRPSDGEAVLIWDSSTGRLARVLEEIASTYSLSADGRYLARASGNSIAVLEVSSAKIVATWQSPGDSIQTLQFSPDGAVLATGNADGTILLWNTRPPGGKTPLVELAAIWNDLAADDPVKAYAAQGALLAEPKTAIGLLRDKLAAPKPFDAKELAQLIANLNHPRYAEREAATRRLEIQAAEIESALELALPGAAPEVEQRLERILVAIRRPIKDGAHLRLLRSLEVLERIATPEARDLLQKMAKSSGTVARDARDSLARLAQRRGEKGESD